MGMENGVGIAWGGGWVEVGKGGKCEDNCNSINNKTHFKN